MPPKREMDFKALARELAEGSIVTQALARFIEQVIQELHETQIAPLRIRAEAAEASLASYKEEVERLRAALLALWVDAGPILELASLEGSTAARNFAAVIRHKIDEALTKETPDAG